MEKIEVELTPVRIVGQPQRLQNEVGVTVLKFKIVIPKIEQIAGDVEHIIPHSVDLKIPDEYVGYFLLHFDNEVLSDKHNVPLKKQGDELKQHLFEQDYEEDVILHLLPNLDNFTSILSTHIVQTQSKYGVAEFSNVPQLYISQDGKLIFQKDQEYHADIYYEITDRLGSIRIDYKGRQFTPSYISWELLQQGYKVGFEFEYSDGSVVESQVGDSLGYTEIRNFTVDYNNLPRSIKVLFKHDDHKFTAELWNSTMQS